MAGYGPSRDTLVSGSLEHESLAKWQVLSFETNTDMNRSKLERRRRDFTTRLRSGASKGGPFNASNNYKDSEC